MWNYSPRGLMAKRKIMEMQGRRFLMPVKPLKC
jgi:hypothetical protein